MGWPERTLATRRRVLAAMAGASALAGAAPGIDDVDAAAIAEAPPGRIWVCIPVEAWNALLAVGRLELARRSPQGG